MICIFLLTIGFTFTRSSENQNTDQCDAVSRIFYMMEIFTWEIFFKKSFIIAPSIFEGVVLYTIGKF